MNKNNATKFKSILVFFDLLNKISQKDIQYLKQQYLQAAENFEGCVDLLLSIDLISISPGYIEPSSQLTRFLKKRPDENETKEFLLMKILSKRDHFILDYLKKFSMIKDKFIFKPQISENLLFSDIRNLLIELELISFNSKENYYEITEKHAPLFIDILKEYSISPEKLKKVIEEQDRIGKYAELEIVSYEKLRLYSRQDLIDAIEHKSLKDAALGYDIKSFTLVETSSVSERFIEVKAIPYLETRFYLTRNELETSRKYGSNYYLYLLPVKGENKFDIANLIIIQDPSNVLFDNKNWIIECEQFLIKKKEDE